jgi:hypothetical protein
MCPERLDQIPSQFVLDDEVSWSSQAKGYRKEKTGRIVEVLTAGNLPDRNRFLGLYKGSGVGAPRMEVSYVVRVKNRYYWPRAAQLRLMSQVLFAPGNDPHNDLNDARQLAEIFRTHLERVTCVAITMLYESHKDDVLNTFPIHDLQSVSDRSADLATQKVEDIYKAALDVLKNAGFR